MELAALLLHGGHVEHSSTAIVSLVAICAIVAVTALFVSRMQR